MAIDRILEKEFGLRFFNAKPVATIRYQCSCGKKNVITEKFNSWNNISIRETVCKKCGSASYLKHVFSYEDSGLKYSLEILTKEEIR